MAVRFDDNIVNFNILNEIKIISLLIGKENSGLLKFMSMTNKSCCNYRIDKVKNFYKNKKRINFGLSNEE